MITPEFSISMSGRTRRSKFWCTCILIGIVSYFVGEIAESVAGIFDLLSLVVIVPLIARRAQDAGLSDSIKYGLIASEIVITLLLFVIANSNLDSLDNGIEVFLSVVGLLVLTVWLVCFIGFMSADSQPGTNKWGANPKEQGNNTEADATRMPLPAERQNVAPSPEALCPVCKGKGLNAAGYTCPVCKGSGLASSD